MDPCELRMHAGDTAAIVLYALNLAGIALIGMLMAIDAQRAGLAEMSSEEAHEGHRRALIVAGVFLISIPVALAALHLAPVLWVVLFLAPLGRRVYRRA